MVSNEPMWIEVKGDLRAQTNTLYASIPIYYIVLAPKPSHIR